MLESAISRAWPRLSKFLTAAAVVVAILVFFLNPIPPLFAALAAGGGALLGITNVFRGPRARFLTIPLGFIGSLALSAVTTYPGATWGMLEIILVVLGGGAIGQVAAKRWVRWILLRRKTSLRVRDMVEEMTVEEEEVAIHSIRLPRTVARRTLRN